MANTTTAIAIVGGGFAGAVTAIKLIRAVAHDNADTPLRISIIESNGEIGRGIAYSTDNDDHIVNGPAFLFGLYPDQPSHLTDWLTANAARHGWTPPAGVEFKDAFPPRRLFGSYVQSELNTALKDADGAVELTIVNGRAVDILPAAEGHRLLLADGSKIDAARVVLALGLFRAGADAFVPTADAQQALGERYIDDVWNKAAWQHASRDEHILIIGSSLTALDAALNAERAGFKGTFHALSRRGLLVQPRRQTTPWPDVLDANKLPTTLRALLRQTTAARRAVKAANADWQQLPPAIRPHLPTLWDNASAIDRNRFLRHIRPFWEITLHRAAPESGKKLEALIAAKRFDQRVGRLNTLRPTADGKVAVEWTPRGEAQSQTLVVDRVANALGYEFDWARIDDPLIRALQERKLVRRHATGFGIDADPATGAIVSTNGNTSDTLYAVGHALRGVVWESNSIPEQLAGATNTANALAATLQTAGSV